MQLAFNFDTAEVVPHDGSNEWYTPRTLIEAVRSFYRGRIDLDPASCAVAQQVVQARRFYTVADDGLVQAWRGRVWCNPPYARGVIDQWAAKAIAEYQAGRVSDLLLLVNNATETDWHQALVRACTRQCQIKRRVQFWHPSKPGGNPAHGQTLIYFGRRGAAFRAAFDPTWGVVLPGAGAW